MVRQKSREKQIVKNMRKLPRSIKQHVPRARSSDAALHLVQLLSIDNYLTDVLLRVLG